MLLLKDKYLPFANTDQFATEMVELGALGGKCEKVLVETIYFLPMIKLRVQIAAMRMELGFAWQASHPEARD
jgi:hypothetical protein